MKKYTWGYHKLGNCWRFRYSRNVYSSGKLTYYCFWRFYLCVDRRFEDGESIEEAAFGVKKKEAP